MADNYSYTGKQGECQSNKTISNVKLKEYFVVKNNSTDKTKSETLLAKLIYKYGPISVAFHIPNKFESKKWFQYRKSCSIANKKLIFSDEECKGKLNHAMVAVGYTPEYFILQFVLYLI